MVFRGWYHWFEFYLVLSHCRWTKRLLSNDKYCLEYDLACKNPHQVSPQFSRVWK